MFVSADYAAGPPASFEDLCPTSTDQVFSSSVRQGFGNLAPASRVGGLIADTFDFDDQKQSQAEPPEHRRNTANLVATKLCCK